MKVSVPARYLCVAALVSAFLVLPVTAAAQLVYGRLVPAQDTEANGSSTDVDVSSNGRTLVFVSTAQNWVGDTYNGTRVIAVDLDTGAIDAPSSSAGTVFRGERPAVSGDGRHVAFLSYNHALGPGWQVLRKDRQSGELVLASSNSNGIAAANGTDDDTLAISDDGRYIVFASASGNLGAGSTINTEIFIKDMQSGTIELVTARNDGSPSGGTCGLQPHSVSGDGRYVTFTCSQDLFPGAGWGQAYVRDVVANSTEVISRIGASGATTTSSALRPALSPNGRFVSFQSRCYGGLGTVDGDCANNSGVYLRDRQAQTTTPIPRPALLDASYAESCRESAVSDVGSIMLSCGAPAGSSSKSVVFLYVPGQGAPELLSANASAQMANGQSGYTVAVNGSGLSMAFESTATDIDPDDHNGASDIFVVVDPALLADVIFADGFETD